MAAHSMTTHSMTTYRVTELIPHAAGMVLLDEVLAVDDQHAVASLTVRADGLFDDGRGRVPGWVGIEYMAQTVALYGGYQRLRRGLPVTLGFLLGTRRYQSNVASFAVGTRLEVEARMLLVEPSGLSSFECLLRGDGIEVSARLNAFQPDDIEPYLTRVPS